MIPIYTLVEKIYIYIKFVLINFTLYLEHFYSVSESEDDSNSDSGPEEQDQINNSQWDKQENTRAPFNFVKIRRPQWACLTQDLFVILQLFCIVTTLQ